MASLETIAEAIAVFGQKREAIESVMKLIMREWEGVEINSKTIQDLLAQAPSELEFKQKHSREVIESVQASYALLNSKKRFLEEGMEKLDGKVKFVREVSKEVEAGQVQYVVMRDSMDQQLKELALKEKQIQHLSESLKLTLRGVEEKKNELDVVEKALNERKDEMDAEKKRLECELESRKASLVEQENLIALKKRTLVERESEFSRKQKIWESELESRNVSLVERETVVVSKELDVESRGKLLEKRENLLQSNAMSDPREKFIQQPDSCAITKSPPAQRRDAKRRCYLFQQSGSNDKLKAKTFEDIIVLDDSESDPEVRADLVLKDTQKRELVRPFNVGEKEPFESNFDNCDDGADELSRRLETLAKDQIIDLLKEAVSKDQSILSLIFQRADHDPAQRKLFVHGFSWETTELQLRAVFAPFGPIEELKLVTDKVTGKLMGYASLLYKSVLSAQKALKQPYVRIGNHTAYVQLAAGSPTANAASAGQIAKNIAPAVDYGLNTMSPNVMASYGLNTMSPNVMASYGFSTMSPNVMASYGLNSMSPNVMASYGSNSMSPNVMASYGSQMALQGLLGTSINQAASAYGSSSRMNRPPAADAASAGQKKLSVKNVAQPVKYVLNTLSPTNVMVSYGLNTMSPNVMARYGSNTMSPDVMASHGSNSMSPNVMASYGSQMALQGLSGPAINQSASVHGSSSQMNKPSYFTS